MRTLSKRFLAGAAAAAALSFCGVAAAAGPVSHVMVVHLPDGGAAQIRYWGDKAPKVAFSNDLGWEHILGPSFAWPDAGFGRLAETAAAMDREMAAMMNAAERGFFDPGATTEANFGAGAPGAVSFSSVSTMRGGRVCTKTREVARPAHGAPKVTTKTYGQCDASPNAESGARGAAPPVVDGATI